MRLVGCTLEEAYVETSFGRTHLVIAGPKDAPSLVLLPGLFADATMWYPNLESLANKYRVFALDMIVYGGKSSPSSKKIEVPEDFASWYAQVLKELGLSKAALAGLSYGSWTALTIARYQPELVSTLILLDPSESFTTMDGGIAWKGFWSFVFFPNRKKYAKFFLWLGGGYTDPHMEVWFEHLLDVIEHGSISMAAVPRKLYSAVELRLLDMPVLVMASGKPILYRDPQLFCKKVEQALPNAEVLLVPDAGHGLNMEKPELVNEKMLSFLNIHLHQVSSPKSHV